jgi:hypothetical protein
MRPHITYANVAATLALVLAMSSGALAATHYLITSTRQISPKVLRQLRGRQGPQGPPGLPGRRGLQGKEGKAGREGKAGAAGKEGREGLTGKDGLAGTQGSQGPEGPLVSQLPAGKTLFALAVRL